jgi:hypothetical protein
MVHVGVSQLPVSRQPIVAAFASYPLSQTREAFDPYVVVVNVKVPSLTVNEDPQSGNLIELTLKKEYWTKKYFSIKVLMKSRTWALASFSRLPFLWII